MKEFAKIIFGIAQNAINLQEIGDRIDNLGVGIPFANDMFLKIKNNISIMQKYGEAYHIEISKLTERKDGSGDVYFKQKVCIPKKS